MIKNKHINPVLNHKLAIKLSLIISFLLAIFMLIGFFFSEKSVDYISQTIFINFIIRFLVGVFITYLLFEYCFWIFRKKWGTRKKVFIAFCGTIGLAIILSPVFSKIMLHFQTVPDYLNNRFLVINLIKDLITSFIVYLTTLFVSTTIRNQQISLENQKLVAENMRNRYEALKNQLNPHFLFNTLNTLDGLIGFDDKKAHIYLQNLSSSFRYTIQNKEITTLNEELNFVETYTYLMKIRYGDNLSIQNDIDEKYNNFYIMPISLQLLIENAIKHNVINDKYPLTIFIETTENDTIKVSNTIQPKINAETGEGVGLANLTERYNLLFDKEVTITQNGVFSVEIPLINKVNE
jgi:sensor histidine kinase YesM